MRPGHRRVLRTSRPRHLARPLRLLLFDIDGTLLLRAAEDHARAVHVAVSETWGADSTGVSVDTSGRTDPEIARLLALGAGVSAERIDARMDVFREACARAYARMDGGDLSHTVAPGIPEALAELAARDGELIALLTGNLEPIARVKLRRAGIGEWFAARQGAFGSDSEDRGDLPAFARRRAAANGLPHPREQTVVIGDTPRDVACARADGVLCVGVATGRYSVDELRGADAVVADAHGLVAALDSL